jgi:hypothetical protein
MTRLQPTHRHSAAGWERFSEQSGQYDNCDPPPPSVKLVPINEHDGWKYFGDPKRQPKPFKSPSPALTDVEKRVLARYGQDIQLHIRLMKDISPGLPLITELTAAGNHVRMILENGYWLEEVT